MAFLTLLAGGTAFPAVEDGPSEWDGMWWAVTTMTTVEELCEDEFRLDLAGELEAAESYALAGLSPATLRAYASD